MLKNNRILYLMLLAALVSAPVLSVKAEESDQAQNIALEKKEQHDHKKGETCPLKKNTSCPLARKKVQDKLKSKQPRSRSWFGGGDDTKDKNETKDGTKSPKRKRTARPKKSWWKFWRTDDSGKGSNIAKAQARKKQERRSKAKRSGKDKKKISKRGGRKSERKGGKKAGKKQGKKKHDKKNKGKKGHKKNKGKKKKHGKKGHKKNKGKKKDDDKAIEVK